MEYKVVTIVEKTYEADNLPLAKSMFAEDLKKIGCTFDKIDGFNISSANVVPKEMREFLKDTSNWLT